MDPIQQAIADGNFELARQLLAQQEQAQKQVPAPAPKSYTMEAIVCELVGQSAIWSQDEKALIQAAIIPELAAPAN